MQIKAIICLLCIIQLSSFVFGQQRDSIDFILLDHKTGNPIEDAFIFYDDTSIGTTSDPKGKARLPAPQVFQSSLVITHINLENYNLSTEQLKQINQIELEERAMTLDMVTVKSKKLGKRKRRRWMKRFENAFLGDKISKKKIRILNPEVLWFEENDDLLSAYAADNIKILNQESGYEILVALQHFSLTKQKDIKYIGKVFFKDILEELEDRDEIEKTRNDIFINSQQLFYKALHAQHPILDQQFDFGITRKSVGDKLAYEKLKWSELNWNTEGLHTIIKIDSAAYLTVMKKDILEQTYTGSYGSTHKLHLATSFLKSKTGKFVFSENGELINKTDIEESGYWTNNRMAKELPIEYTGNISIEKKQVVIIKKLVDYEIQQAPEKIYIHTDKSIYFPYETMWFKGYVLNAVDHRPSELSDVVYVELLNSQGEIVESWMLHDQLGYVGDYKWPPNIESGNYLLRAYTNYMRNQDSSYFFEKRLQIRTPLNENDIQDSVTEQILSIEFFPEGGDLITGISSNVTVKATVEDAYPVPITAQLIDNNQEVITEFQTMHKGLGVLNFTPEDGLRYSLRTEYNDQEYLFDLPVSKSSGISIQINPTQKDYVFVHTKAVNQTDLSGAYLVGHVRGSVFAFIADLENQEYKLSKSSMPTGVVHFTVFDHQNRPQAERLIFNDYNYDQTSIQYVGKMKNEGSDHYVLQIDSLLQGDILDMSASIVDVSSEDVETNDNIKSYLFLQSDLQKNIPDVHTYLDEISASKLYYLDLFMRSMYWRRFNWKDLLEDENQISPYHAEKNFSIKGYTSKADKEEGVKAEITLNTLGPEIIYDQKQTESDGTFEFFDIPLQDSTEIFLQARLNNGNKNEDQDNVQLNGNRLVDIHLSTFNTEKSTQKAWYYSNDSQVMDTTKMISTSINDYFVAQQRADTSMWSIDLDAIEISQKREITFDRPGRLNFVDFDNANWIAPETHGVQLINKVAPSLRFTRGAEAKLLRITTNNRGQVIYVPMQVIIDGVGANPEGSDVTRFSALPADRIKSMAVAGSAIFVTTRNIPRSTEKYLNSGILTINHPGYSRAREFSSSEKTNYPLLSTMYWTPNVEYTQQGEIVLPIQSIDQAREYMLTIEGVSATGHIIRFNQIISSQEQ